jgi:uncharacterized protein YycO
MNYLLRKVFLVSILVFFAALISASQSLLFHWPTIQLSNAEKANLRNGDIIFRKAEGMVSDYIISVDSKSIFSHSGLIHISKDKIMVLNASFNQKQMDSRVHEESIDVFLGGVPSAAIYRLRQDYDNSAEQALSIAQTFIGLPFDFNLDKDNSDALYCTELVWLAYKQAGVDLLDNKFSELDLPIKGHGFFILPSDLVESPKLFLVMTFKAQ